MQRTEAGPKPLAVDIFGSALSRLHAHSLPLPQRARRLNRLVS
jgi:hypothetical protein